MNNFSDKEIKKHNLTKKEFKLILKILGRYPNLVELGIFSVMWSEHCSYKSTKKWLKTLPSKAPWIICGPGENAGIIDIGNQDAIVFKMESHNHPSFIEPYQGAATGVGGIMRDIFTMGARPIANLNSLRFGSTNNKKTKYLLSGVVSGIGDYGNCVGVPTVGGECFFHESYNNNNLVNAMCVGLVKKNKIFYSIAKGNNYPVIYVGAKTGRDGIHGATMASAEFDDESKNKRPQVQVGDPFTEKLLMEACLELMNSEAIIAIQDMGAAGLTSSSFEMASKGDCGIDLFLDKIPTRESKMQPYEIMLSETQERMLMVINPSFRKLSKNIFKKWGLNYSEIGVLNKSGEMRIFLKKNLQAKLPIKPLVEHAPEYDSPSRKNHVKRITKLKLKKYNIKNVLLKILSSPNYSSKEWIFNQYDKTVMGDTLKSSEQSDSAIIRIHNTNKAIAIACDCNPIYCKSDPFLGSIISVAENWRNLIAAGSKPLAITDNLNFGNPEKKEIMFEIKESIKGIGYACKKLNFPVVSGNVSLYNETKGKSIYPTPVIGGVGLIKNLKNACSFKMLLNHNIFILGKTDGHLGCSAFYKVINKNEMGLPPKIDLDLEKKNGLFLHNLILSNHITGCHDISDGGFLIALAEMIIANNLGAKITLNKRNIRVNWLFGEDQSRYIIIAKDKDLILKTAKEKKIYVKHIGHVVENELNINDDIIISVKEMIEKNKKWFISYNN